MRTVDEPVKRKEYEKARGILQAELCALKDWFKEEGLRVVVVFDRRDAAGR
jgi:polyphosphate kinase